MDEKTIAIIEEEFYQVGYPQCAGCANLCFPAPVTCLHPGDGCEYPDDRVSAEAA